MPYKKTSKQKRYRRKTAKGNWQWSYYRGLYKKIPKKTPKKKPKRLNRRTLRNESPLTPPEYYNKYLNPNTYRLRAHISKSR